MKFEMVKFLTAEEEILYGKICDEIINLLRKKHKLTPIECGNVLTWLLDSLKTTMGQEFWEIMGKTSGES